MLCSKVIELIANHPIVQAEHKMESWRTDEHAYLDNAHATTPNWKHTQILQHEHPTQDRKP
jgi:hypothetical protein